MPDYIYLLENRLSAVQQSALRIVRDLAREAQQTVFLTGDAVRDLTCGNPVRGLEVTVHGNALSLKSAILTAGGKVWGEDAESRTLYLWFPGSVEIEVRSGHRAEFSKPGKPVFHWTSIQEDLRARDFTINAMAISLNEGSYGLLMDPSNGVADIEARLLRLVSNYGFIENPVLLVRATRMMARLAFELEERTQTRYENAKHDDLIAHIGPVDCSRELEQIAYEDEPLKVMHALEAEGWMQHLFAQWTAAKADVEKLTALHDLSIELQVQGVHPNVSAAQMQLLTAKLAPKELAELKTKLLRPGFVEEWNHLDASAAEFAKVLLSKEKASASATYNLFTSYAAEAVLWLGFTSKQAAVKDKYEKFLKEWPQARQRIPYALMVEMRITPELPGYQDLVMSIFLQLIDGGLTTAEEMRALLEPHSPPAPPPPVTIKRTRAKKGAEAKSKRVDDEDEDADDLDADDEDEDEDGIDAIDLGSDDMDLSLGLDGSRAPLGAADGDDEDVFADDSAGGDDLDTDLDADDDGDDDDDPPPTARKGAKKKAASARRAASSESEDDDSTAAGAGLKALALKLDLIEPSDPANLDEADPIFDLEEDEAPGRGTKAALKNAAKAATPAAKKQAHQAAAKPEPPVKAAKPAPPKAPVVAVKTAGKVAAKPAVKASPVTGSPAKAAKSSASQATKTAAPKHAKPLPAKLAKAVAAKPKSAAAGSSVKGKPAKSVPVKSAAGKSVSGKSGQGKAGTIKAGTIKAVPVKAGLSKAGPIKSVPVKAAAGKSVSGKFAASKVASAKSAPAKGVPAKGKPGKAAPAKVAPVKGKPAKGKPAGKR